MKKLTDDEKAQISTTIAALRAQVKELESALSYERAWRRQREERDDDLRGKIKEVVLEILGR